ncbi:uncharacterized protein At5g39865-like [Rutidosis leptorrhynchoides]|uniref:uncharacterized protein At5g39865-like n=1 Tax=Rutidosis leptorrhynchoides TaxID=125765 RepID=UPI003A990756
MGCTPSKEPICRNCNSQCSPVRRSYSSYPNLSPRYSLDNHGHHVVELTSTTLGYLLLDPSTKRPQEQHDHKKKINEISNIETETWSKMIDERIMKTIPKTPIRTPHGEPETINTWELMEGLDDSSPIEPLSTVDQPTLLTHEDKEGDVKKLLHNEKDEIMSCRKEKLVLYFTSLRGIRKTYEDCCHVRVILKNSGVRVDERDVSMHSGFKEELKELLGDQYGGLPKVFVGKKCIGGADEIRKFQDEFKLDKVFEGCEMMDDRDGGCDEGCGDVRFILCDTCSGSCKIYNKVGSDECEIEVESDYGFQRCPDCNENGLVRCPICCY